MRLLTVSLAVFAVVFWAPVSSTDPNNYFLCPYPETSQQSIPISNQCDGENDCPCKEGDENCALSPDEENCTPVDELECPSDDFELVPGANAKMCYHMRDVSLGAVTFFEAKDYCEKTLGGTILPRAVCVARPNSIAQLESLADWAVEQKGLPGGEGSVSGFYLGYIMLVKALIADGDISEAHRELQRDEEGYFADYKTGAPMQDIWREGQPDNKNGNGETCVAKKRLFEPRFVGADDYMCEGDDYVTHYVLCETLAVYKTV